MKTTTLRINDRSAKSAQPLTVTVSRKNTADRIIAVRITTKTFERLSIAGSGCDANGYEDGSYTEADYERAARTRAAEKLYGANVRFQSDTVPHRGQVWTPAKSGGGGENAVTDVITMRVTV